MNGKHFPILIITGRPAAGKSEVIDFLKRTDPGERSARFHIAEFEELDDFVYVWETFETDDILTKHGKRRKWTDKKYWFNDDFIWNLYIERISLEYRKKVARNPAYHDTMTTLIEFARGGRNGIHEALTYLHDDILKRAALMYIRVSYEESVRKNHRRARKGQEDSILYHSLPDEKMKYYYKINDWDKLEKKDPNYITVKGFRIPYGVFENEPEKTLDPALIGEELERVTTRVWGLRESLAQNPRVNQSDKNDK